VRSPQTFEYLEVGEQQMSLVPLLATGSDCVTRAFYYSFAQESVQEYRMRVYAMVAGTPNDPHMELLALAYNSATLRTDNFLVQPNQNDAAFRKKGLPEAMILELAKVTLKSVRSSCKWNTSNNGKERRSREADKLWNRLVKLGLATYFLNQDTNLDHFELNWTASSNP
jgi:hypothetical protein